MNKEELKAIYEYMGWKSEPVIISEWRYYYDNKEYFTPIDPEDGTEPLKRTLKPKLIPLDSNSAWECVQEMVNKKDWVDFQTKVYWSDVVKDIRGIDFIPWLYNPANFFDCFGKWCLERRGK